MTEAVGKQGGGYGGDTVRAVPHGHAGWLLRPPIPLRRENGEQRETARLEEAEEKAGDDEAREVVARGDANLRNAPAQHHGRHEDARADFDDEDRGHGLPSQLCGRRHGSDDGVLVSLEMGVFLQAEYHAEAEDDLVENLMAVSGGHAAWRCTTGPKEGTWRKYTQAKMVKMTRSVFRRMRLFWRGYGTGQNTGHTRAVIWGRWVEEPTSTSVSVTLAVHGVPWPASSAMATLPGAILCFRGTSIGARPEPRRGRHGRTRRCSRVHYIGIGRIHRTLHQV